MPQSSPVGLGIVDVARGESFGTSQSGLVSQIVATDVPSALGGLQSGLGVVWSQLTLTQAQIQANNVERICSPTPPAGRFLVPLLVVATAKLPSGGLYSGAVSWGIYYQGDSPGRPIFNASLSLTLNGGATTRRISTAQPNFASAYQAANFQETPASVGYPTYSAKPLVMRGSGAVTGGSGGDLITFSIQSMICSMPA